MKLILASVVVIVLAVFAAVSYKVMVVPHGQLRLYSDGTIADEGEVHFKAWRGYTTMPKALSITYNVARAVARGKYAQHVATVTVSLYLRPSAALENLLADPAQKSDASMSREDVLRKELLSYCQQDLGFVLERKAYDAVIVPADERHTPPWATRMVLTRED